MGFQLTQVEAMAPDQASLNAASKLAKPNQWASLAHEGDLWWGECQGSGANPYRAVVDSGQVGYKCTCPSRKLPCKHSLALMWIVAQNPASFADGTTPQWVTDWLGRRRTTTSTDAEKPKTAKSIDVATRDDAPPPEDDPAAEARNKAAAQKRQQNTRAMIADGLDDLDQWVSDQLMSGLMAFLDAAPERCRRIAARLMDNKASGLASRLDEMPSRLLALPPEERPDAAVRELGTLVLMAKAWRADPDDPQIARDISITMRRDDVLASPDCVRVTGQWEVVGEQIRTRRDGLVSHSTWFLRVGADAGDGSPLALLLDFYPASAGRRESSFTIGAQYLTTMAYYPAPVPLRAIALDLTPTLKSEHVPWPASGGDDPLAQAMTYADAVPWQLEFPLLLPSGRIAEDGPSLWWKGDGGASLPLASGSLSSLTPQILGTSLTQSVGIWDGSRLALLATRTPLGKASLT